MPKAYSYRRFSSKRQEGGDSLRRQIELAEQYAKDHGLTLDLLTFEDLGISAFKGRNVREGSLAAFLKAVDDGLIVAGSYLLVESLDRLSRAQVDDALQLLLSIVQRGIVLVTLTDRVAYSKESIKDNWTKLVIALAVMARANEESEMKSRRVSAVIQYKLSSGQPFGSSMPPWLELNAARTEYLVIAQKAEVVRRLFRLALDGNGIYLIQKQLNDEGIPVLRNASRWDVSSVAKILHAKSVIGTLESKHGTFEGHYPAIIQPEDYYKVQELIATRNKYGKGRKGDGVANLLSGLVRCECGSPMTMARTKNNKYLACVAATQKHGCSAVRINYEPLEVAVLERMLLDVGVPMTTAASVDPTLELRAEIAEKEGAVQKLLDLIEASGSRESKNLLGRLTTREEELAELQRRLANVTAVRAVNREALHEALAAFRSIKSSESRLRVQSSLKIFIEKIVIEQRLYEGIAVPLARFRRAVAHLREGVVNRLIDTSESENYDSLIMMQMWEEGSLPLTRREANQVDLFFEVPRAGAR